MSTPHCILHHQATSSVHCLATIGISAASLSPHMPAMVSILANDSLSSADIVIVAPKPDASLLSRDEFSYSNLYTFDFDPTDMKMGVVTTSSDGKSVSCFFRRAWSSPLLISQYVVSYILLNNNFVSTRLLCVHLMNTTIYLVSHRRYQQPLLLHGIYVSPSRL